MDLDGAKTVEEKIEYLVQFVQVVGMAAMEDHKVLQEMKQKYGDLFDKIENMFMVLDKVCNAMAVEIEELKQRLNQ